MNDSKELVARLRNAWKRDVYMDFDDARLAADAIEALMLERAAIHNGMVLVPREPTEAMLISGREADWQWLSADTAEDVFESGLVAIYKAMIAAGESK